MTALDVPSLDPADDDGASSPQPGGSEVAASSGATQVLTAPAPPLPAGITHQPALDGLRGLAVAGVLL
ncbi:hypothetical protein B7486_62555, partial [cyanobacterium TDX16]